MKIKKLPALFLCFVLLFALVAPAASAAGNTITISTADELRKFAVNCKLDSYSKGLNVILANDIDLEGVPIDPIGSFCGYFNGKNHTIRGVELSSDGSYQGLFRYIGAEGSVINLHVEGNVNPSSLRIAVGGVVGVNYGTLSSCSFSGTVRGLKNVGGIAGENYGEIKNCTGSGSVSGKEAVGGICGYNEGLIDGCANKSDINTVIEETGINVEDLSVSDLNTFQLVSADDENTVSDCGGIVGCSSGVVSSCKNDGTVGYPHYGYNIGGIAGRQSGYVEGCVNNGDIFGKKDIGGICGQMEPYMILTQVESLLDELNALNSSLNYTMAHLGNNSAAAGAVVGNIQTNANDAANNAIEMDKNSDDPQLPQNQEQEQKPSVDIGEVADKTEDYIGGVGEQIGSDTIGNIAGGNINDDDIGNLIGAGGTVIGDAAGAIGDKINDKNQEESQREQNYNQSQAALNSNMNSMAANVSRLNVLLADSMGDLAGDMMGVNSHFAKVSMLVANLLSGNALSIEDISQFDSENVTDGKVCSCTNNGSIDGDINVGSISGDMGIEMEYDLEGTILSRAGDIDLVRNSYETRCIARECVNNGAITAKKDYLGGITGYQEIGYIVNCIDYGSIVGTDSVYVGGIAGYSSALINESYTMCDISGATYVGGIVGYGCKVTNCVSMINLTDTAASCGAIAGWADISLYDEGDDYAKARTPEEQEAAKLYYISNNIYVHDTLGAVDDLSYEGRAYPVNYTDLVKLKYLPDEFRTLTINFRVDGETVSQVNFIYGGSLTDDQIPEVPARAGYTGYWSRQAFKHLRFSCNVDAVYVPNASSLSSEMTRDDSPMSLLLAEGSFTCGSVLKLSEADIVPNVSEGKILESWAVAVENNSVDNKFCTFRYLMPQLSSKNSAIVVYILNDNGSWTPVDTKVKGSYAVFSAPTDELTFCAVEVSDYSAYYYIGAAVVLVAAAAVFVVVKKKKQNIPTAESAE